MRLKSLPYLQMRNWTAKGENGIKLIKSYAYVSEIVAFFFFITNYAYSDNECQKIKTKYSFHTDLSNSEKQ